MMNIPEHLVIYETEGVWSEKKKPDLGDSFLGYWVESGYTFFFFDRDADTAVRRFFDSRPEFQVRQVHRMLYSQWQDGAGFQPFSVDPLVIIPAWDETPTEKDPFVIRIDPGLAFGFGGHPTTYACLKCLVRVYKEDKPMRVLDFGAGTGVLSLAAARLGASDVTAVEYSHLAFETAKRNAEINRLDGVVNVIHGLAEDEAKKPADLVCSNLHLAIQEAVMEKGGFEDRRWLILSGLFHDELDRLERSIIKSGYKTIDKIRDERWGTLLMKTTNRE